MSWKDFFKSKPREEYEISVSFERGKWIVLFGTEPTLRQAKSRLDNYYRDMRREWRVPDLPRARINKITTYQKRRVVYKVEEHD